MVRKFLNTSLLTSNFLFIRKNRAVVIAYVGGFYAWSFSLNYCSLWWKKGCEEQNRYKYIVPIFLTTLSSSSSTFDSKETCLHVCWECVLFQKQVYSEFGHREMAATLLTFIFVSNILLHSLLLKHLIIWNLWTLFWVFPTKI